jgi:signal transduction histidine kinase
VHEIFTMFSRPGVGSRPRTAGMGVGLALARQLAEQHGGSITVRSAGRDLGATFTVRFPLVGSGKDDGARA